MPKYSTDYVDRLLFQSDPMEAVFELDRIWCARPDRTEDQLNFGLAEPEFTVHLAVLYLGEVGNGGHAQFFSNPAGAHAEATLAALSRLNLTDLAAILVAAMAVLPGSLVPRASRARNDVIAALPDEALQVWDELDRRLYRVDIAAWPVLLRYLRENRHQILAPERA